MLPSNVMAQNLSGIWKGYFSTGFGDGKKYYKYEIQFLTKGENVSGVSYSYLNEDFYGKSHINGFYNPSAHKIQIKETKLISFTSANSSNVCLMHSTLNYFKRRHNEVLEGVFTSTNNVTGEACSEGYVYLERRKKSDFYTEPFLAHQKLLAREKKKISIPKNKQHLLAKSTTKPKKLSSSDNHDVRIINDSIFNIRENLSDTENVVTTPVSITNSDTGDIANPVISSFANIPIIFQNRKNKLVKTIITHTPEIDISFYDNGEVDDDTITVYHNLKPIIDNGRLSRQAIQYGFDASESNRLQSFIIVADNLGKIPPNSALMVIYTNHQRYEVFIESDLGNNGEVRIIYEPPPKKK